MFVLKSTLEKQEQEFEAKLLAKDQEYRIYIKCLQDDLQELEQKYEDNLIQLDLAKNNEKLLNEQTGYLSKQLLDCKATTLPESKFHIDKAVTLLTTKLSAKTLATFLFKLVEALGYSHLQTLNNYTLRKLTTIKEKENGN